MDKTERGKWQNAGSHLGMEPSATEFHFPLSALFIELSVYFQCEVRSAKHY